LEKPVHEDDTYQTKNAKMNQETGQAVSLSYEIQIP
jgi:hypothetical protein